MQNKTIKEWIESNLWTKSRKQLDSTKFIKKFKFYKENKNMFDEIYKLTNFLDKYDVNISERIYCIINDINEEFILCESCRSNKKIYKGIHDGYSSGCSHKCSHNTDQYINAYRDGIYSLNADGETPRDAMTRKMIETMTTVNDNDLTLNQEHSIKMKENWNNYSEEEKKARQDKCYRGKLKVDENGLNGFQRAGKSISITCSNRTPEEKLKISKIYSKSANNMLHEVRQQSIQKAKNTKLNDIDENGLNSYERGGKKACNTRKLFTKEKKEEIRNKIKETILERYGVDNPMKNIDIQIKAENTRLEKYGVKYLFQNPKFVEKSKKTCLLKYGVDNVSKAEVVKQKIVDTMNERYGVDHYLQYNMIPLECRDDYTHYKIKVIELTENNYRKYFYDINPLHLQRGKFEYHLDHKFSISEGFKNNIPIHIISSRFNLELLPASKNISKGSKCSITIEELIQKICR